MSRYIDADKINPSDVFGGMNEFAQDCRNAVNELLNIQPTADVAPVKHGEWKMHKDTGNLKICSLCGNRETWTSNYCPNCGAMMDLEG